MISRRKFLPMLAAPLALPLLPAPAKKQETLAEGVWHISYEFEVIPAVAAQDIEPGRGGWVTENRPEYQSGSAFAVDHVVNIFDVPIPVGTRLIFKRAVAKTLSAGRVVVIEYPAKAKVVAFACPA